MTFPISRYLSLTATCLITVLTTVGYSQSLGNQGDSPEAVCDASLRSDAIDAVLKSLTYREREILKLRFGLGEGYACTLEEVARIFKVTRERVRQVEAKAIRKLQHPSKSRKLESFVPPKRVMVA